MTALKEATHQREDVQLAVKVSSTPSLAGYLSLYQPIKSHTNIQDLNKYPGNIKGVLIFFGSSQLFFFENSFKYDFCESRYRAIGI